MNFAFIDVETPNRKNDSICSMGVVETDRFGNEIDRSYFLVNPEDRFDDVNMRIHGIAPIDVANAPTFETVWIDSISPLLQRSFIVAHNASFDLNVLSKAAERIGAGYQEMVHACTKRMARELISADSCKLADLCAMMGIRLDNHHNALGDAVACEKLFWRLADMTDRLDSHFSTFIPARRPDLWCDGAASKKKSNISSARTIASKHLLEVLANVASDGKVTDDEMSEMLELMLSNDEIASDPAYGKIMRMAQEAYADGVVTDAEAELMLKEISSILDPVIRNEVVRFPGSKFCLTGAFSHGSRDAVKCYIESRGGKVLTGVTGNTDYVVVGLQGSEAYSFGNYGSKVKKALELREKGKPVMIVSEECIYS